MNDRAKNTLKAAVTQAQTRALTRALLSYFMDGAKTAARNSGGSLSSADLDTLGAQFAQREDALGRIVERSFEETARAQKEAEWASIDRPPLERLLVQHFETCLMPQGDLSRRILPAFFLTVNMMLGPDAIEDYQTRCRIDMEANKAENGGKVDWDALAKSRKAMTAIIEAQAAMALTFTQTKYRKRMEWFIEVINANLADGRPGTKDQYWLLTPAGFHTLMVDLFADLARLLKSKSWRAVVVRKFGDDAPRQIENVLEWLLSPEEA